MDGSRGLLLAELSGRKRKDSIGSPVRSRRSFGNDAGNVARVEKTPMKIEKKEDVLRQRRLSLTPEDKENLLKSESKVLGAALNLHVIHDVPLQKLEKRLEDWGVDLEMRKKAIETIKAKTNALATKVLDEQDAARRAIGAPPLLNKNNSRVRVPRNENPTPQKLSQTDPLAKYKKMIQVGIPPHGAMAAARKDGISSELCAQLCPVKEETRHESNQTLKKDLSAYKKMLALGVQSAAVRARMLRDGLSEKDADLICPIVTEQNTSSTTSREKKSQPKVKALHWQKLEEEKLDNTVWAMSPPITNRRKSYTDTSPSGTVCDDDDLALLEELFASAPPPTTVTSSSSQSKEGAASLKKISLLTDSRRSANVAIGLTYFGRRYGDDDSAVCRAVYAGDEWLDAPRLRSLQVLLPNAEELALIRRHLSGPPMPTVHNENQNKDKSTSHGDEQASRRRRALERLARPERFFAICIDYPQLQRRVECGIFMDEWEETVYTAKHAAKVVSSACEALRQSRALAKILKALLQLGNRLNRDRDHLGAARGIALCSLERFVTAKGHDGTNLIDYLLTVLHKKNKTEQSLAFLDDLPDLNTAARHADDDLTIGATHRLDKQFNTLTKLVAEFNDAISVASKKKTKANATSISPLDTAFFERAQDTAKAASPALEGLRTQIAKLNTAKNALRTYFAEKPQTSIADIFQTLDSFLSHLKAARDRHRRRAEALERVRLRDEARAKANETTGRNIKTEPLLAKLTNAQPQQHLKTNTKGAQRQAEPHPPDNGHRPAFSRIQVRSTTSTSMVKSSTDNKSTRKSFGSRKSDVAPSSKVLVSKAKYAHDKMCLKHQEEATIHQPLSAKSIPPPRRQPAPPVIPPPSAVASPRSLLKMYATEGPKSPDDDFDGGDDYDDDTTITTDDGSRRESSERGTVKNRISGDAWWKSSTQLF